MDRRLPPQAGEWIDRSRPIEFRFEGTAYRGFAGDVIASALWAQGVRLMGRSFKYHRPRSVYSLAGHDANVLLDDTRRTNIRGDVVPIEPGLDLWAVNTVGGLYRDRLRCVEWFSRFLPVGFYYKAFHTPRGLFPFYENRMRRIAGLGRINPTAVCAPSPKEYAHCDLLVVGAGPAGLSAAIAAAERGLRVVLVDEQPRPGGSLCWQWRGDDAAGRVLDRLLGRVRELPGITIRCGTQAAGWYADHWVPLIDGTRLTKMRANAMLVATGCFEQPAVFQNNDLPGVMLASAAQRLIHLYAVRPFDRAVVLTANSDGYRAALDLHAAGVAVAAVVDLRPDAQSTALAGRVAEAGISVHPGAAIYEAVPTRDRRGVRGAVICPLDHNGRPHTRAARRVTCDGIVVSVGWTPAGGLISQAGGRFQYTDALEQLTPHSLPAGIFAAGRVNGVFDLESQLADGRRAGLTAAASLGGPVPSLPEPADQFTSSEAPSHPYPIFAHPGKKNFVDLDEDLHLADFANAHQEGYDNIELLKRFTTVGMGPSQGKLSNFNAVRILARLNGASIPETGTTTSRPFHQPAPIGLLAGRRFHPERRTPLHHWHVRAGAAMAHAGGWLRPEHYAITGRTPAQCALAEATHVRNGAGVIDVSTLGKFAVSGPDAAHFLERLFTGRFANQPIGRARYALACDETGVIIEDGVVARLAEHRFLVTATSSGAAAFYREMQRWALIWNMDVILVNATSQFAAMNLAGPNSRAVLRQLTDVDLSAEAFPYLAVRAGEVAGVPATILRVGFVGELGYEIHVPATCGLHVWESLIAEGRRLDVRPFGVDAQRLLRLEKGHLIVGQDTDALTSPFEANLAWAIGRDKPYFVGARSLNILRRQPLKRRLVGLTFPPGHAGPLPDECHLLIEDGEIAGRVTSIAGESTLGRPIALAFVRSDLDAAGRAVHIRLSDGSLVEALVAALPFYDPDNIRQHRTGE